MSDPLGCRGCGASARGGATMCCTGCWQRLPGDLRTAILRAWGRRGAGAAGAREEHTAALVTAEVWFAVHPR